MRCKYVERMKMQKVSRRVVSKFSVHSTNDAGTDLTSDFCEFTVPKMSSQGDVDSEIKILAD